MLKLKSAEMRLVEDLFEMGGGYVLDFTNQTFAEFFMDELSVDINASQWHAEGGSKAKRLRFYLRTNRPESVVVALNALWAYRESNWNRLGIEESISGAEESFNDIVERLGGTLPKRKRSTGREIDRKISPEVAEALKSQLLEVSKLDPIQRGFAFEKFLKELFDVSGLEGRASFRNTGEQIDGSFELNGETYLLEGKWQNKQVGVSDLRSFNGKVEDKTSWARGLLLSESGFSDDGLTAFGRGNSVVCMDGLDLYEMLEKSLSFAYIMSLKVRRATETGKAFTRVRDLDL